MRRNRCSVAILGAMATSAMSLPFSQAFTRELNVGVWKEEPPKLNPKVKDNRPWWQTKRW